MAKPQQLTITLTVQQVRAALEAYAAGMVDPTQYDIALIAGLSAPVAIRVTRKRAHKAKVAAVPKAAA